MKLKLFLKSFDETLVCRRSWTKLRSPASPPKCKLETASSDAWWTKLLTKILVWHSFLLIKLCQNMDLRLQTCDAECRSTSLSHIIAVVRYNQPGFGVLIKVSIATSLSCLSFFNFFLKWVSCLSFLLSVISATIGNLFLYCNIVSHAFVVEVAAASQYM